MAVQIRPGPLFGSFEVKKPGAVLHLLLHFTLQCAASNGEVKKPGVLLLLLHFTLQCAASKGRGPI